MIFYLIATSCLLLVAFIMLCRANDLRWRPRLVKRIRLIGLLLTGFSPWGIITWDFWINQTMPSPFFCIFLVGLCCVFITTPRGVPFWKWLWQGDCRDHVDHHD